MRKLIAGPGGVYICDECVHACTDMIDEADVDAAEAVEEAPEEAPIKNLPTPHEIYDELSQYVMGQEQAKRAMSVGGLQPLSPHPLRKRRGLRGRGARSSDRQEQHPCSSGPTGTGKTLFAQTLARILEVPFAIADATTLTEAGYVGEDVENILLKLITAADGDVERAAGGHRLRGRDRQDRPQGGEPLHHARRLRRGRAAGAPQDPSREPRRACPRRAAASTPSRSSSDIDTTNILFICGGAFVGLDKIVADRIGKKGIGFAAEVGRNAEKDEDYLMEQVMPQDLHKFGMIPEFLGRIPVITATRELTESDLVSILTQPRNALVKQYRRMFELEGVELVFEDDALEEIARQAIARGTGARGLRAICEATLQDTMFDLPSDLDITKVIVTKESVGGGESPRIVTTAHGKHRIA